MGYRGFVLWLWVGYPKIWFIKNVTCLSLIDKSVWGFFIELCHWQVFKEKVEVSTNLRYRGLSVWGLVLELLVGTDGNLFSRFLQRAWMWKWKSKMVNVRVEKMRNRHDYRDGYSNMLVFMAHCFVMGFTAWPGLGSGLRCPRSCPCPTHY